MHVHCIFHIPGQDRLISCNIGKKYSISRSDLFFSCLLNPVHNMLVTCTPCAVFPLPSFCIICIQKRMDRTRFSAFTLGFTL